MNDKQKFFAIGAGALLVGVIIGFFVNGGTKENTPPPQQQQQQTNNQLPEGHPSVPEGSSSQTPAEPIDMKKVVADIDAFFSKSYPGDWKVDGEKLSKGDYVENDNFKIVDELENTLGAGSMISIFIGEKRVSTNVKVQGAERAFDYPVPTQVAEVMKSGEMIDGGTSSMGEISFAKAYLPLKDKAGKTVAVMSISISQ